MGLTTIGGDLVIMGNDALTSLTGLENVIDIEGYLWITDNASLNSLTGLENLTSIEGVYTLEGILNMALVAIHL